MSSPDAAQRALQHALASAVQGYAERRAAGERFAPFPADGTVTATDVVIACSEMLKAADVEIFELAMWEVYGA